MAKNRDWQCVCVETFTHVIPESVLEIRKIANSAYPDTSITTPEKRIEYVTDQIVTLSSKRNRTDFMKFHAAKFKAID